MNKSEKAYIYLKRKILNNQLKPGTGIKIDQIAGELSVSKSPVREAIRKLEAEGLVEVVHNTGAKIKVIDINELEQIVLIRQRIETLAVGLSAENIDKPTIKKLRQMIDAMERCVQQDDKTKYSEINRDFHMEMYRASKAGILVNMIEDLWNRSERTTMVFNMFPDRFTKSNKEHMEMVDCLEKGDRENAERILYKQKEEGFVNVVRILKEYEKLK